MCVRVCVCVCVFARIGVYIHAHVHFVKTDPKSLKVVQAQSVYAFVCVFDEYCTHLHNSQWWREGGGAYAPGRRSRGGAVKM